MARPGFLILTPRDSDELHRMLAFNRAVLWAMAAAIPLLAIAGWMKADWRWAGASALLALTLPLQALHLRQTRRLWDALMTDA